MGLFKSDVVVESLKIIFGSMENICDSKFYTYSSKEHKNELEIPPHMVAVAATAVRFIYIVTWHSDPPPLPSFPLKTNPDYSHTPCIYPCILTHLKIF